MVQIIRDSIKDWGSNDDVQCVVYESAPRGGKAFCAGGDVRAVYEAGKGPFPENDRGKGFGMPGCVTADFFRHEYQMNHAIATLGKPQVAVWDGIVMGGGVGLTAHGKYRIATERALFAMPETAIGLFPDVGMTYALPRLQPPPSADGTSLPAGTVGRYLGLTGARLKGGADLLWSGLATHSLHSSQLPAMHEALTNPSLQGGCNSRSARSRRARSACCRSEELGCRGLQEGRRSAHGTQRCVSAMLWATAWQR